MTPSHERHLSRFLTKVIIDQAGCWLWEGRLNKAGYGYFGVGSRRDELKDRRRTVQVHRFAYEVLVGPIPDGLQLDHLCHTNSLCSGGICVHRSCCNPDHLEPVTPRENSLRVAPSNRPGRENGRTQAKLSPDDVLVIKHQFLSGARNVDLARHFGVDPSLISRIRTGHKWADVCEAAS